MASLDHLSTLAEVAIALAGFSALVAVLAGGRGRSDPRLDAFRLQMMLESSLLTAALALLPLVLSELAVRESLIWKLAAGTCLLADLSLIPFSLRRARRLRELYTTADRVTAMLAKALAYTTDGLMLCVVLGVSGTRSPGFYLLGLYLGIVLSGIFFARFANSTFVSKA